MADKPNGLESDPDNAEGSFRRGYHHATRVIAERYAALLPLDACRELGELEEMIRHWRYWGSPDRWRCPPDEWLRSR